MAKYPESKSDTPSMHSQYLSRAINVKSLNVLVNLMVKDLKQFNDEYEGIAVRGTSGLLVGPMVAAKLKKELLIVRKPSEIRHSPYKVEGNPLINKYIILDDMVASGQTVRDMVRTTKEYYPFRFAKFVGLALYQSYDCDDNMAEVDTLVKDLGGNFVVDIRNKNTRRL